SRRRRGPGGDCRCTLTDHPRNSAARPRARADRSRAPRPWLSTELPEALDDPLRVQVLPALVRFVRRTTYCVFRGLVEQVGDLPYCVPLPARSSLLARPVPSREAGSSGNPPLDSTAMRRSWLIAGIAVVAVAILVAVVLVRRSDSGSKTVGTTEWAGQVCTSLSD